MPRTARERTSTNVYHAVLRGVNKQQIFECSEDYRRFLSILRQQTIFFELIRVSIGTQDSLSRLPKEAEWCELFGIAVKQSLVGVCFAGVKRCLERVCEDDGLSQEEALTYLNIPFDLYYNWMGMAFQIEQRNAIVDAHCVELQESLAKIGVRSSILKGQGIAKLYDNELASLRQSGDIDIYVDCGRVKAIEIARKYQDKVDWDIKHLHLKFFPDTAVEMHYRVEVLLNLMKNRKLQKWFKEPEVVDSIFLHSTDSGTSSSDDMVSPSVEFNLFYILLHIYRHFLYEGVGMRQLMDYYFVLRASSNVPSSRVQEVTRTIEVFGMKKFASGLMWIMKEVFGLSEHLLLCAPDEKEGRFILNEVMAGGNFGHHDKRLKDNKTTGKKRAIKKILKHNLHLLTHYPGDTLWAPVWIVYHWCWKQLNRI